MIDHVSAEIREWKDLSSVICIGHPESTLIADLAVDFPALRRIDWVPATTITPLCAQGAVLVLLDDPGCDLPSFHLMLATLRDTAGARLIVTSNRLSLTGALALGFRRLRHTPGLYVFDLYDYKSRPEWFNAQHFAHPQRWDPLG
ncbi:MAG: DUF6231 family protein [Pseudomonadota bacterium]